MVKRGIFNLKSNKGFTIQDLVIAMTIFTIFATIIGSILVVTFKIQSDSQVDEVATLYVIQIAEYIDKISFDEVENDMEKSLTERFNIPTNFVLTLDVTDYNPEEKAILYIKQVRINLEYTFSGNEKNILIDRLKIREL